MILRRKSILLHLGSPQSVLADTFGETAIEPLAPNLRNSQKSPKSAGFNSKRENIAFLALVISPPALGDIKKLNDSLCGHAFYFLNGTLEAKKKGRFKKWNKCLKIMSEVMIPVAET